MADRDQKSGVADIEILGRRCGGGCFGGILLFDRVGVFREAWRITRVGKEVGV